MARVAASLITVIALVARPAAAQGAAQQGAAPATGRDVIQGMRDGYGGRWYRTLTFVQKTTKRLPDGRDTVSTWYESVRWTDAKGTELRIDIGPPALGNGVLYTADSVWIFRGGALSAHRAGGNALLPLILGVYVQPVDRTLAELRAIGIDWTRPALRGTWKGRAVWIAGASSAADSTSPQLWVDAENHMMVRAIFPPVPSAAVMDMRFEGIERAGAGWLATVNEFYVKGALAQREDYRDWKADVALSPQLFDPATYGTAPHWAVP